VFEAFFLLLYFPPVSLSYANQSRVLFFVCVRVRVHVGGVCAHVCMCACVCVRAHVRA